MSKKRVNEQATSFEAEKSQPKRPKSTKIKESRNPTDYIPDSEVDPGHIISQKFLALTRKNTAAMSDEILSKYNIALEDRKKGLLDSFEKEANTLAKEHELRRLVASLLLELSPVPKSANGARLEHQPSAFASSNDLHQNKLSTLAASKMFSKDYRHLCQEIAIAREKLPAEVQKDSSEKLQILLEKQARRLKGEVHAILDGKDASSTSHYDTPAEKELWTCFGAAKSGESGKPYKGESWSKATGTSKRALRRLVQCLPEKEC